MSGLCRCPQVSILTDSIVANIKTSIRIHTCTHTEIIIILNVLSGEKG